MRTYEEYQSTLKKRLTTIFLVYVILLAFGLFNYLGLVYQILLLTSFILMLVVYMWIGIYLNHREIKEEIEFDAMISRKRE